MLRRLIPLLVLAALLPLLALASSPPAAPTDGEYTGPEACRSCHPDLFGRWGASAHALSTEPMTPANAPPEMLAGETISHPPGESTFRRDGDRFFVTTMGPDGERHEYPVTHIVGPHRINMFLTRMDNGRLQVLPFLREIPTGVWFDYTHFIFAVPDNPYEKPPEVKPGEPSFWTGPIRAYDTRCGRCHTSGRGPKRTVGGKENGWTRTEWDPVEVDCEACHGPGREHVEFWRDPPAEHAKDPMIDLARVDRETKQAACLWCHMESDVVSEDFRPGDDVFDYLTPTLLDNTERLDAAGRPLELVYDGLSFLFSACAEKGGLTCVACHDAHGSSHASDLRVPETRTFTLCLSCHQEYAAEPGLHTKHDMTKSGGRCVSCHMPFLTIERGHGVVRDHTLGSPMPELYGGRVATDACTWCHQEGRGAPGDAPVLTNEQILASYREWYPGAGLRPGWVKAMADGRTDDPRAVDGLMEVARDETNPRIVRASAVKLLAENPNVHLPYLLAFLEDDDSLVRRAAARGLENVWAPDADYGLMMALEDEHPAVRAEAARAALSGYTRVQRNPALLAKAIPALREAANSVPLDDERWFRLGAALQIAGDKDGAIAAYERKLALDPYARLVREAVEKLRR